MAKFESKNGKLFIDGKEIIKGFESFTGWYWFATELSHVQDSEIGDRIYLSDNIWFGFVQGPDEDEWGYFSQAEIESLRAQTWEIPKKNLPYSGRRN